MEPVSYNKKQLMCSGASVLLAVIEKNNLAQQGRTLVQDSLSTQKPESLQRQQIQNTCKQTLSAVYSGRCYQVSRVAQSAVGTSYF